MNLTKLFEAQKILRDRINYQGEDRFNKLVLALLVELGECANEWRGFKFWSTDQEPRTNVITHCDVCGNGEDKKYGYNERGKCLNCYIGYGKFNNLLLEEYVDGLHFVLELGLEINYKSIVVDSDYTEHTAEETFIKLYKEIAKLPDAEVIEEEYKMIFNLYVGLAEEHLGFTWEEVETAYFKKNKINHARQDSGY